MTHSFVSTLTFFCIVHTSSVICLVSIDINLSVRSKMELHTTTKGKPLLIFEGHTLINSFDQVSFRPSVISIKCPFEHRSLICVVSIKCRFNQESFDQKSDTLLLYIHTVQHRTDWPTIYKGKC